MTEQKELTAHGVYERFRMPFPTKTIKWRLGATNQRQVGQGNKPTRGLPLPYIESRDVMDRLDQTVGFQNWQSRMQPGPEGILVCTLLVRVEGEWVEKTDVAGETGTHGDFDKSDSQKGSGSDALKRAAVQFHIGRYLYWIKPPWIDLVEGKLPEKEELEKLLPSWASPAGWKREVLKLDGRALAEQEQKDLAAQVAEYKRLKGAPVVTAVFRQLGFDEDLAGWTTGMVEKFVHAIGTMPDLEKT